MPDFKYFENRASVRDFSAKEVPMSLIEETVALAMRAPTTGNMQLYTVIATERGEIFDKLVALHFNQPAAKNAQVLLTVCADFNRFTRWCELSDADPGYDNFHSFLTAMTDAVIVSQQIVTVAEMKGLGSCYLGTVTYNADEISELLELPNLTVPVACIALGWPSSEAGQCERLPLEAVLHKGKYRHDDDKKILDLFKAKDEYEPNMQFVAENAKNSLAQVFTDIRYPRGMNESVSDSMRKLLVKKSFLK